MVKRAHDDAFDARIRSGYAVREPIRKIADALGVSRNTIIGRARRLGLSDPTWRGRSTQTIEGLQIVASKMRAHWADPNWGGRSAISAAAKRRMADPAVREATIRAMHAGRDRYWAARRSASQ